MRECVTTTIALERLSFLRLCSLAIVFVVAGYPARHSHGQVVGFSFDAAVYDVAVDSLGGRFYAVGAFTSIDGLDANRVAVYDDGEWHALGAGLDGTVESAILLDSMLIVGGRFDSAAGVDSTTGLAAWDGQEWRSIGSTDDWVHRVAATDSAVVAAGRFTTIDGVSVNAIARWRGETWEPLGEGLFGTPSIDPEPLPYALAATPTEIIVGGDLRFRPGDPFDYLGLWNGAEWSPFGYPNGIVSAIHIANEDKVYLGGAFTEIGGSDASHVALWDGNEWQRLGEGFTGQVFAIASVGPRLFAGGLFTRSGTTEVRNLAELTPSGWIPVGTGTDGDVIALASDGEKLLVAGFFSSVNGTEANNFAIVDIGGDTAASDPGARSCTVSLFPNPTRGPVSVKLEGFAAPTSLTVHDLLGRRRMELSVDQPGRIEFIDLDLSEQATGAYALTAMSRGCGQESQTILVFQ